MSVRKRVVKVAVAAMSILLVGGYVAYRANGGWRSNSGPERERVLMPGSKRAEILSTPERADDREMMSSSKLAPIVLPKEFEIPPAVETPKGSMPASEKSEPKEDDAAGPTR